MKQIGYRVVGAASRALNRPDPHRVIGELWKIAAEEAVAAEQFNHDLADAIRNGVPVLVGRPGSFEAQICNDYLRYRHHRFKPAPYSKKVLDAVAAVRRDGYPLRSDHDLDVFAEEYIHSALQSDFLVFWKIGIIGHEFLLRHTPALVALADIEPTFNHLRGIVPWTAGLAGKKVLVVHPFKDSIEAQHRRRASVHTVKDIMPDFDLEVVVPPQTYAGWKPDDGAKWTTLLRETTAEIATKTFDVAIVAAGPYGLPIAAFVKAMGRPAIHLAGATQLLFGIRGRRWDDSADLITAFDDSWVRPLPSEVPPDSGRFERSPYW